MRDDIEITLKEEMQKEIREPKKMRHDIEITLKEVMQKEREPEKRSHVPLWIFKLLEALQKTWQVS